VERVTAKPKVVARKAVNGDVRAQRVSPRSPPGYAILSGAAKAAAFPQQLSGEDLKTMRFDPIKYVVPGIIVEGLTLFAGKPKIGKSWLLLHAAIAVARGGFTLGDVHCAEGDCMSSEHFGQLAWQFERMSGSSGLKVQAAIAC